MRATHPHFLLFSTADASSASSTRWQFVLESLDGSRRMAAGDEEPGSPGERAELLAVVRGLEALDQPSRVTLVTRSRYVSRGIVRCIEEWRAANWMWDRFGRVEPIRDHDLWQRVDRAMSFHEVHCHTWPPALDRSETIAEAVATDTTAASGGPQLDEPAVLIVKSRNSSGRQFGRRRLARACDALARKCHETLASCLRCLAPLPKSA
jgi:ribonuclease HI